MIEMQKRSLGQTGLLISPVIYGGIVSMRDGQDKSDQYVAYAIDKGINYFDVAPLYGDAQEKLGNSLRPYRKDVFLACKTMQRQASGARQDLEESLRLLHTDYLDNYQLHGLSSVKEVETAFSPGGVMEVMRRAKETGLIRFAGITCHDENAALLALSLYDFDTVLFPMNWGLHLGKGFGESLRTLAKEKHLGFLGLKSMIHRAWASQQEHDQEGYPKSWCKPFIGQDELMIAAIKYTLSLGIEAIVPPGNFEHFKFAVDHIGECLAEPLSSMDLALLKRELANIKEMYFL
jgi:hypothetical protein